MLGKRQEAIDIFNETIEHDDSFLSNKEKSSIYLSLALAYEHNGNKPAAIEAARKVKQLADKDSPHDIQATSIIYYCEGGKLEKLLNLEKKARRNNYIRLANTIALTVAKDKNYQDKANIYRRVLETRGDYYNHIGAIIEKIELLFTNNIHDTMSSKDYQLLLFAYSYSYFQRLMSLFNRFQRILWILFLEQQQYTNLLRIFRHSSFIWRIQGDFDKEKEYLGILKKIDTASLYNNADDIDIKYLELRRQEIGEI